MIGTESKLERKQSDGNTKEQKTDLTPVSKNPKTLEKPSRAFFAPLFSVFCGMSPIKT